MEPEARYTVVGLVVVVLVAILAALVLWLRSSGEGAQSQRYKIYFEHQSLEGLQRRETVTLRGVKVGSIVNFRFSQQRPGVVEVVIAVDPHAPVRESTVAVIERNLLTGLATLRLVNATEESPLLTRVLPGEPYPVICEGESKLQQVSTSLDRLVAHADETMQSVSATLSPENRAAIADILDNVRRVSRHADATLDRADAAMASIGRASGEVRDLAASLKDDARTLTARYDALGAETTTMIGDARGVVRKIGDDADRVAQRADAVLASSGAELHETARALRSAADSVGDAASRLRNPQQAIFGPAAEALGPGEGAP